MFAPSDRILIVVAHPDDDVLGAGGSAAWLSRRGIHIQSCILSGEVEARTHRPTGKQLRENIISASNILGLSDPLLGSFPNIRLNAVPHLELVQFIEAAMQSVRPNVILTSHPSDINDDHRQVSHATQAAARLHQRGGDVPSLKLLAYMEILSSTDWAFQGGSSAFTPTMYVPIGEDGIAAKTRALHAYQGVMRPYPHPRSDEAMRALATVRGAQSGVGLAEAFEVAHLIADGE